MPATPTIQRRYNLTGHFLVAMPLLSGSSFEQTVVFVADHGDHGAMGLIINRPSQVTVYDVFNRMVIDEGEAIDAEQLSEPLRSQEVLIGGPMQSERGFVLHTPAGNWNASLRFDKRLALTTSRDILEAMSQGKGPEKSLICLGYSGWSAGQLEEEILDNAWIDVPVSESVLFDTPSATRFAATLSLLGISDAKVLSLQAGHA